MIFTPFEKFIAKRYLRSKRKEGFISVIAAFSFTGIMLGVATLIIVMSVMNGFRIELVSRILGVNGHINVYGTEIQKNYDWAQHAIMEVDGVTIAAPLVENQALLQVKDVSRGVVIRGISAESFKAKTILSENITAGDLKNFEGNSIIIGSGMASRLRLNVGDEINLLSPQGKASPFGTVPKRLVPKVVAVFEVGMHEYDSNFIFMPLPLAQKFFNSEEMVSTIEVTTSNPENLDKVIAELQARLGEGAQINDWKRSNGSFFTALQVERNVMFLILTLIILVAAFNIISSLIMLVKDKGKEIAILRTIGASRQNIMKIFVLTGMSVGIWGTLSGALIGILFAVNIETIRQGIQYLTGTNLFSDEIYYLSQLPAVVNWSEVVTVVLMALVLSLLATIYPAWRAAKLDPVEALRYE